MEGGGPGGLAEALASLPHNRAIMFIVSSDDLAFASLITRCCVFWVGWGIYRSRTDLDLDFYSLLVGKDVELHNCTLHFESHTLSSCHIHLALMGL